MIRMKGDRYLHRKFPARGAGRKALPAALGSGQTKIRISAIHKKKRAEQAANAKIQREIRIKEAIEKEKEEEEQRLQELLMVEEEEDAAAKEKRKERRKGRKKRKERRRMKRRIVMMVLSLTSTSCKAKLRKIFTPPSTVYS